MCVGEIMIARTKYDNLIKDAYFEIWRRGGLTEAQIQRLLVDLDAIWPQEQATRSSTKIYFDDLGRLLPMRRRPFWVPNPGIDPKTSYYQQNANNGRYIPPEPNFEFNDILYYSGAEKGNRRGGQGKIIFESRRFDDAKIYMFLHEFSRVARQMVHGHLIGRWTFTATSRGLHLVPLKE